MNTLTLNPTSPFIPLSHPTLPEVLAALPKHAHLDTSHPEFTYPRSQKVAVSELEERYQPRFIPDSQYQRIISFHSHREQASLSIKTVSEGTLHFKGENGIAKQLRTRRYHSYVICRGLKAIDALPIIPDETLRQRLSTSNLQYKSGEVIVLYPKDIPLFRRSNPLPTTNQLTSAALKLRQLEARLKVIEGFLQHFNPPQPYHDLSSFSVQEQEDLKTLGIGSQAYHPPRSNDTRLPCPALKVLIAGLSKLPKVEDVLERQKDGRKQTTAGQLMATTCDELQTLGITWDMENAPQETLEHLLSSTQEEHQKVRLTFDQWQLAALSKPQEWPESTLMDNNQTYRVRIEIQTDTFNA